MSTNINKLIMMFAAVFFAFVLSGAALASDADTNSKAGESKKFTALTAEEKELFEQPILIRRQTLMVRDIEKSLALYRDAMGLEPVYDQVLSMQHPTEDRIQKRRIVVLKAQDRFVGTLGLLEPEYGDPDHPSHHKPIEYEWFSADNVGLLFNTREQEKRWPLIKNTPGVKVINDPVYTEFTSYDGEGKLQLSIGRFYDPDGNMVEFNQLLGEMH